MIFTVDIGNTNIKIGLFDEGGKLAQSFKMSTDVNRTSDEYVALLLQLLSHSGIAEKSVTGAIVSSVIPQLDYTFTNVIQYVFGVKPLVVGVGVKTGLAIKYDFPRELGSDRIITCVAADKSMARHLSLWTSARLLPTTLSTATMSLLAAQSRWV